VHRLLLVLVAAVAAAVVVPVASALDVHMRVEGKTRTIFGASDPLVHAPLVPGVPCPPPDEPCAPEGVSALSALDAASLRGEFYYHLVVSSLGAYVDQIGRFAATGSSGWAFKVDGASPPVGADAIRLKKGDRVLWYWATFGPTGGPPTLRLVRRRGGCYRVLAEDDSGRARPAVGAVVRVGGRRMPTRAARACIGPHRGLVRATREGSIRSNALA
jgi:Domain of unknown function (DUF4430)